MTVKESLQKSVKILSAKNIGSANLDAELLLLFALSQSKNKPKFFNNDRSWLYAHSDYELSKKEKNMFLKFISRREKFEPVAYITKRKEFYGLEFYIDKNVLIPRPETEILVENALKEILNRTAINRKIVITDIGTGSGAIAVSIAKTLKDQGKSKNAIIYATDISRKALKIAEKNAKNHNCDKNIIFKKGDLLKALPKNTKIDYLLANLPYGGKDYLYKRLRDKTKLANFFGLKYEPEISIFAANDGMIHFENFFKTVANYLSENAKTFMESDPRQIPAIKRLAKKYLPKNKIAVIKDLRGLNRITQIEIKSKDGL